MITIKLCSNYQQIELSGDNFEDLTANLESYIKVVNYLGASVVNTTAQNNKPSRPNVEMATHRQIDVLIKMGVPEYKAKAMTKKEAWSYINED